VTTAALRGKSFEKELGGRGPHYVINVRPDGARDFVKLGTAAETVDAEDVKLDDRVEIVAEHMHRVAQRVRHELAAKGLRVLGTDCAVRRRSHQHPDAGSAERRSFCRATRSRR